MDENKFQAFEYGDFSRRYYLILLSPDYDLTTQYTSLPFGAHVLEIMWGDGDSDKCFTFMNWDLVYIPGVAE